VVGTQEAGWEAVRGLARVVGTQEEGWEAVKGVATGVAVLGEEGDWSLQMVAGMGRCPTAVGVATIQGLG
jgi:hypothetical protein